MRPRRAPLGFALFVGVCAFACCRNTVVLYEGARRPREAVALLMIDANRQRGEGASWEGDVESVDGQSVRLCPGSGVAELLPGCHVIAGRFEVSISDESAPVYEDSMVTKPGVPMQVPRYSEFESGLVSFEVPMKAGFVYELSARMNEGVSPEIVEIDPRVGAVGWHRPLPLGASPTGCSGKPASGSRGEGDPHSGP